MGHTAETLARIIEIAKARVEGMDWAAIALKWRYANAQSACTTITQDCKAEWREAYERARELYMDEVESEAILTQRSLLREEDKHLRQSAAHSLLAHTAKLRAQKIQLSGDVGVRAEVAVKGVTLDAQEVDNGRVEAAENAGSPGTDAPSAGQ